MSQLDSYELEPVFGCMLWTGKKDKLSQYGLVWRGKTPTQAHRVVYEQKAGPIPEGMVADHLCKRPLCINVEHLEIVTQQENLFRRKQSYCERTMIRCRRGHDLKLHVMRTPEGGRLCRKCMREAGQ
jgi:hypothetical protein